MSGLGVEGECLVEVELRHFGRMPWLGDEMSVRDALQGLERAHECRCRCSRGWYYDVGQNPLKDCVFFIAEDDLR